jgi:hypothetical protein
VLGETGLDFRGREFHDVFMISMKALKVVKDMKENACPGEFRAF